MNTKCIYQRFFRFFFFITNKSKKHTLHTHHIYYVNVLLYNLARHFQSCFKWFMVTALIYTTSKKKRNEKVVWKIFLASQLLCRGSDWSITHSVTKKKYTESMVDVKVDFPLSRSRDIQFYRQPSRAPSWQHSITCTCKTAMPYKKST